jgi:hypothetical protein
MTQRRSADRNIPEDRRGAVAACLPLSAGSPPDAGEPASCTGSLARSVMAVEILRQTWTDTAVKGAAPRRPDALFDTDAESRSRAHGCMNPALPSVRLRSPNPVRCGPLGGPPASSVIDPSSPATGEKPFRFSRLVSRGAGLCGHWGECGRPASVPGQRPPIGLKPRQQRSSVPRRRTPMPARHQIAPAVRRHFVPRGRRPFLSLTEEAGIYARRVALSRRHGGSTADVRTSLDAAVRPA